MYRIFKKINGRKSLSKSDSSVDGTGSVILSEPIKTNFLLNSIIIFFLYVLSFYTGAYIKFGTLLISENYLKLFGIMVVSLLASLFLSNKYNLTRQHDISQIFRKLYISLILTLGIITILVFYFDVQNIARTFVIGVILSGFVLESIYLYAISERRKSINLVQKFKVSIGYLFADFLVLTAVIYLEIVKVITPNNLTEKHYLMIAGVLLFLVFFCGYHT